MKRATNNSESKITIINGELLNITHLTFTKGRRQDYARREVTQYLLIRSPDAELRYGRYHERMSHAQTLAEYLASKGQHARSVGAQFVSFDARAATLQFIVITFGEIDRVSIHAAGLEDWCLAPNHLLLVGADRLELVTSDPKVTREHLESLDCEGCRTDYPDRVVMLRNGNLWVVAEQFYVTVESRDGRLARSSPRH